MKIGDKITLDNMKEGQAVTLLEVFGFNLVSKNETSLDYESHFRRSNVKAYIERIDLSQDGVWTEQGWYIYDLIQAGLVVKRRGINYFKKY